MGIILVQLYWINTSYQNNEEQFKYHVKQVIGNVANKLQQQEAFEFYRKYNKLKDSIGKAPKQSELKEYFYVERNPRTNEQIIYSNTIIQEEYTI